jgi:hypothetical protein
MLNSGAVDKTLWMGVLCLVYIYIIKSNVEPVAPLATALGIFRSAGFMFCLCDHVISPMAGYCTQTSSHWERFSKKLVAEVFRRLTHSTEKSELDSYAPYMSSCYVV